MSPAVFRGPRIGPTVKDMNPSTAQSAHLGRRQAHLLGERIDARERLARSRHRAGKRPRAEPGLLVGTHEHGREIDGGRRGGLRPGAGGRAVGVVRRVSRTRPRQARGRRAAGRRRPAWLWLEQSWRSSSATAAAATMGSRGPSPWPRGKGNLAPGLLPRGGRCPIIATWPGRPRSSTRARAVARATRRRAAAPRSRASTRRFVSPDATPNLSYRFARCCLTAAWVITSSSAIARVDAGSVNRSRASSGRHSATSTSRSRAVSVGGPPRSRSPTHRPVRSRGRSGASGRSAARRRGGAAVPTRSARR